MNGLSDLERSIAQDLDILSYPDCNWVLPWRGADGRHVYDVIIVGAGQGGLGTAFALKRNHVANILVVDRNPEGREGPWVTYARMETLRTVKNLNGPDGDIPNLAFRSWYEAQFGATAWEKLVRVPRETWMNYLRWFRRVLALPVRNDTNVVDIRPESDLIRLDVEHSGRPELLLARKVILQTGLEGSGSPSLPAELSGHLPRHLWSHTSDLDLDAARMRGGQIGVLGAGASAFDNALAALDLGAEEAHLFARQPELPRINFMRGIEFFGFFCYYADLDDLQRWRFMRRIYALHVPPPPDTFEKAVSHPGFRLHLGCGWDSTRVESGKVAVETRKDRFVFDKIIFGTGFDQDIRARPELRSIIPVAALWRDRFTPPAGEEDATLGRQPYLGPSFEFTERVPGEAPWLRHVRFCSIGGWPSMGPVVSGINGMKFGLRRIVDGVCRDLFREDAERHYAGYLEFSTPELTAAMPEDPLTEPAKRRVHPARQT